MARGSFAGATGPSRAAKDGGRCEVELAGWVVSVDDKGAYPNMYTRY
jgi:hypothetical protein